MTLHRPSEQRNLPVRLCDIRPEVRLHAARIVARTEPRDAGLALAAALHPSTRTYYVRSSAAAELQAVAA